MEKKIKQPRIRYKGYADAWEQRKLGDISNIRTGPFGSTLHAEDYVEEGTPIITTEHFKVGDLPNQKKGIPQVSDDDFHRLQGYVLKTDDIVFSRVGSVDINALITPSQSGWLFSGRVLRVRTDKSINSQYLHFELSTERAKNDVISRAVGQTMPSINTEILKQTKVYIPSALKEQEKIGKFFEKIDNLITLHQRKLEDVKNMKSGLLQKMFPQNGEKFPGVRFSGFTDAWEQRRLGELGKTQSGIGFPDNEQGGLDGVPFFKVSDMNNAGNEHEMKTANNYVTDEQLKRKKWKPIETVPAVVFAKVGAAIMLNRKRIIRSPFLIDNNTMAYIFDESWDFNFGKTLFETINLPSYAQVGALPSYNGSDIERIEITIPKRGEQATIGSFFTQLDHLITLHHCELKKLQDMKKTLLQKMFV